MSDGGKGSTPRPYSVTKEVFDSNWDRIFKKKSDEKTTTSNGPDQTNQSFESGNVVVSRVQKISAN